MAWDSFPAVEETRHCEIRKMGQYGSVVSTSDPPHSGLEPTTFQIQ